MPFDVVTIIRAARRINFCNAARPGSKKCFFWLHDFFPLCPNYLFQRNNKAFCNTPQLQSNACGICLYGQERRDHLARISAFFEHNEVHVVSPSEVALSF